MDFEKWVNEIRKLYRTKDLGPQALRSDFAGRFCRQIEEVGDERVGGSGEDLFGGAGLLNFTLMEDGDVIGQFEGLVLIVGHKDGCQASLVVKLAQPFAKFFPDLGVEGAKRLVQKQDFGFHGEGPSKGDSLALSAG